MHSLEAYAACLRRQVELGKKAKKGSSLSRAGLEREIETFLVSHKSLLSGISSALEAVLYADSVRGAKAHESLRGKVAGELSTLSFATSVIDNFATQEFVRSYRIPICSSRVSKTGRDVILLLEISLSTRNGSSTSSTWRLKCGGAPAQDLKCLHLDSTMVASGAAVLRVLKAAPARLLDIESVLLKVFQGAVE